MKIRGQHLKMEQACCTCSSLAYLMLAALLNVCKLLLLLLDGPLGLQLLLFGQRPLQVQLLLNLQHARTGGGLQMRCY